jgi:hypothetical protein
MPAANAWWSGCPPSRPLRSLPGWFVPLWLTAYLDSGVGPFNELVEQLAVRALSLSAIRPAAAFPSCSLLEDPSPDRSWVLRGEPRTICGGEEYSSAAWCPCGRPRPLSDNELDRIAPECPRLERCHQLAIAAGE